MRKDYDFSSGKKNPHAGRLKAQAANQHDATVVAAATLPAAALRMARFVGAIIAWVSSRPTVDPEHTNVACLKRPGRVPCPGEVEARVQGDDHSIVWTCPVCGDSGVITRWEGTSWDRAGASGAVQPDQTRRSHDTELRAFKAGLAGLRRRKRFIPYAESRDFAIRLSDLLDELPAELEPRIGVEQVAAFFRADEAVFEACDDSDGSVGDVFRMDACARFVEFAIRCEDKVWLGDLVYDLVEKNGYGVRDSILARATRFLPETVLRALAERAWQAASVVVPLEKGARDWNRDSHLLFVEAMARQLNDPRLFERARRAYSPTLGTAACTQIAEAWLAAGEPAVALQWLERVDPKEHFMQRERDDLLAEVYRLLGRHDELAALTWRRFRDSRSAASLAKLLDVIGTDQRAAVVAESVEAIGGKSRFVASDALFLLDCDRPSAAAEHVVVCRETVNGDRWEWLVPLAERLEDEQQPLAATVVYRALLDAILASARTGAYGHGARHLRRLERLAQRIPDWRDLAPHADYFAALQAKHRLKRSFWARMDG